MVLLLSSGHGGSRSAHKKSEKWIMTYGNRSSNVMPEQTAPKNTPAQEHSRWSSLVQKEVRDYAESGASLRRVLTNSTASSSTSTRGQDITSPRSSKAASVRPIQIKIASKHVVLGTIGTEPDVEGGSFQEQLLSSARTTPVVQPKRSTTKSNITRTARLGELLKNNTVGAYDARDALNPPMRGVSKWEWRDGQRFFTGGQY
ncbi:unnamed protein product [Amoebophrya sp. A25]|nr:unnamed protein product [Amoebophrya sp. A25]|eukprot:GSA25T00017896001.1